MGLVGSLEDLSLLDILQIVNVSKRTGVLKLILNEEEQYYIFFKGGKISEISGKYDELSFIELFEKQGLIEKEEREEVLRLSHNNPERAIEIMIQSNLINEKLLEQARKQELSLRLKDLVKKMTTGDFAFYLEGEELNEPNSKGFLHLSEPVSPQVLLTQGFIQESKVIREPEKEEEKKEKKKEVTLISPKEHEEEIEDLEEGDIEIVKEEKEEKTIKEEVKLSDTPIRIQPVKSALTIVLVAEDSIFKNILWQKLLEHFSYVERISNLKEYLQVVEALLLKKKPLLVVTDLLMPTSDGKGFTGGLEIIDESKKRFPEVKIILLSDLQDPIMDDIAKAKGALLVIRKPELSKLKVSELESSITEFAEKLSQKIEELFPAQEEELFSFFKELGAEPAEQGVRVRDQISLLKGLLGELANPKESPEISLLVLRLASEYFERALLLLVKKEEIVGLGGFGQTGDNETMYEKVKRLRMPVNVPSAWKRVVDEKNTIVIKTERADKINIHFAQAIGTFIPKEMVFIPMVSKGRVIAILYADNGVSNEPIPDLSAVEIFMMQAGMAMEKALLERQLLTLKRGLEKGKDKE